MPRLRLLPQFVATAGAKQKRAARVAARKAGGAAKPATAVETVVLPDTDSSEVELSSDSD